MDVELARRNGVCPRCEGYGGRPDDEACQTDPACAGSCPNCRCPGCWDGQVAGLDIDPELALGSWEAYAAVQELPPQVEGQETLL